MQAKGSFHISTACVELLFFLRYSDCSQRVLEVCFRVFGILAEGIEVHRFYRTGWSSMVTPSMNGAGKQCQSIPPIVAGSGFGKTCGTCKYVGPATTKSAGDCTEMMRRERPIALLDAWD